MGGAGAEMAPANAPVRTSTVAIVTRGRSATVDYQAVLVPATTMPAGVQTSPET